MTETKLVPVEPTREMIISALASALEAALDRMEGENPRSEHGFDDEIAQAEQALSMLSAAPSPQVGRGEDGWQDISTAPRDGTIILVAVTVRGDRIPTVYEARWNEEHGCFSGRNGFLLFDGATHWRPLPQPPTPTTEG